MGEAGKYLMVYLTGAAGIWKGVPLGIALNLNAFLTGLLTALGSITTILILFFAGDTFRQWIISKYGNRSIERKKNKFLKLTNRYGVWILGLISPGILGPIAPLLMGLIFIKDTRRFIIYLIIGITLWSFLLAFLFTPIFDSSLILMIKAASPELLAGRVNWYKVATTFPQFFHCDNRSSPFGDILRPLVDYC